MARCTVLGMIPFVVGCSASRPCYPAEPRVLSQSRGIPKPIFDGSAALVAGDGNRLCQVLFEPAFSNGNAVWFTNSLSGDAVVSVTVLTSASHVLTQASHVERYSVELDPKTASQLKNLCESFLERPPPRCDPMGFDGVWYHAAHYVSGRGYLMRSFWTPRRDSVERRFVELAEALRDFATSPASLRTEHWWRIQDTADALREAQGMPFFDPKLGEMQPPANVNRVVAPAKGQSEPSRTESN